jgi:hypothetical protein
MEEEIEEKMEEEENVVSDLPAAAGRRTPCNRQGVLHTHRDSGTPSSALVWPSVAPSPNIPTRPTK